MLVQPLAPLTTPLLLKFALKIKKAHTQTQKTLLDAFAWFFNFCFLGRVVPYTLFLFFPLAKNLAKKLPKNQVKNLGRIYSSLRTINKKHSGDD